MTRRTLLPLAALALLLAAATLAQNTNDPFPQPIAATEGVVRVSFVEFASLPGDLPARMMLLTGEPPCLPERLNGAPCGRRLFVNEMTGPLYTVSADGKAVTLYVDINDPKWSVGVQSQGNERGFQSFAVHPQFNQRGSRGFGKFYTYLDTTNMTPAPDFRAQGAAKETHDTVLLEWTAEDPAVATYDGGPPRELIRLRQPFANHNAGHVAFNPNTAANSPEFGLLYMGVADGGSGGDPLNLAQNMGSAFGKVFRIDPLGNNSTNKKYGIPASNPFVKTPASAEATAGKALPEIYASGVRNPQRFAWDPRNNSMYLADIGQNIVEELSPVTAGANLGWNAWEGSFRFVSRQAVDMDKPRSDPKMTYPIAEYGQVDPLLQGSSAATGVVVYRGPIPQLANKILFGDNPSGEIFWVNADKVSAGGQDPIRRVLFNQKGATKTLLELIRERNLERGRGQPPRADLRFGTGPDNQVFILNKRDNTIRLIVPDAQAPK